MANPARGAEALLRRPAEHVDAAQLGGGGLGDVGGAVGAVVVDDEDVGVGQGGAGATKELVDVLRLDVRRGDDERAHLPQTSGYLLQRR
jgi:hypothetical protein